MTDSPFGLTPDRIAAIAAQAGEAFDALAVDPDTGWRPEWHFAPAELVPGVTLHLIHAVLAGIPEEDIPPQPVVSASVYDMRISPPYAYQVMLPASAWVGDRASTLHFLLTECEHGIAEARRGP